MANQGNRSSWLPRWLRHRSLITAEAILLVGVGNQLLQQQLDRFMPANWLKVLWLMACTLGVLGVLVLVLRLIAVQGVAKTHAVVRILPLPLPYLLVHMAVFAGIFLLYAQVWHLPVWT